MSHKNPGQLTSAKEVCGIYNTPFDPTSRVLQIMAQHDILQAEQGAKGGYQIIKDLNKISLRELSFIIVGPIEIANCFHGDYAGCEISQTCHIISPMLYINENINTLFNSMMIGDLIQSKHSKEKNIRSKKIPEKVQS